MKLEKLAQCAVAIACAIQVAGAASGRVADPEGKPIAGARACLMVVGAEGLCATVDDNGFYRLPDSTVPAVRIVASGFLPKTVAAVDQEGIVVLERAAAFFARLLDAATGKPIPEGEITLTYASGERKGPFPARAAGVKVKTIVPGEVIPTARAKGYVEGKGAPVILEPGREAQIVLKLQPE